jgi:putative FmdB family regulatory protein
MPIFEFHCRGCGLKFEELMTYAQMQSDEIACPDCGSGEIVRGLSAFSTGSGSGPGLPPCGGSGGGCGGAFT